MAQRDDSSIFDAKHQVMQHGSEKPGVQRLCYADQARYIDSELGADSVVLDVGCGPRIPYHRTREYTLIGLDPSYESVRHNREVDLRVYGFAGCLPLADRSVDTVMALYAVHHFGGRNRKENQSRVTAAFAEFTRVLKPGGNLFVFELQPWWLAWKAQIALWDMVRRVWPKMDIFFWREQALANLVQPTFGSRAPRYRRMRFRSPILDTFAPAFAFPRIQIPRFMFPFHIQLYRWSFPSDR